MESYNIRSLFFLRQPGLRLIGFIYRYNTEHVSPTTKH